ncbi:hypothetical protein ABPG72_000511 [Tetrahymena utriculariae]
MDCINTEGCNLVQTPEMQCYGSYSGYDQNQCVPLKSLVIGIIFGFAKISRRIVILVLFQASFLVIQTTQNLKGPSLQCLFFFLKQLNKIKENCFTDLTNFKKNN